MLVPTMVPFKAVWPFDVYIFSAIKQDPDGSRDTDVGTIVGASLLMFIYFQLGSRTQTVLEIPIMAP